MSDIVSKIILPASKLIYQQVKIKEIKIKVSGIYIYISVENYYLKKKYKTTKISKFVVSQTRVDESLPFQFIYHCIFPVPISALINPHSCDSIPNRWSKCETIFVNFGPQTRSCIRVSSLLSLSCGGLKGPTHSFKSIDKSHFLCKPLS